MVVVEGDEQREWLGERKQRERRAEHRKPFDGAFEDVPRAGLVAA